MSSAMLKLNEVSGKWEAWYGHTLLTSSKNRSYVVDGIRRGLCIKAREMGVTDVVGSDKEASKVSLSVASNQDRFTINQRFDFLENFVGMVAKKTLPSLLVTGEGGLGKTFTVNKALKSNGYVSFDADETVPGAGTPKQYVVVKGYSTPKGLYRILYENRNNIVVFDDCDSVLRDPVALNLLKGALDSYDKRVISWVAETLGKDEDLPRSFTFRGAVIFISNLTLARIDQAIRSRSIVVDLSMTTEQKIDRMEVIAVSEDFMPEYRLEQKQAAIVFLRGKAMEAKELTLRSLNMVVKMVGSGKGWEDRAEYLLTV